jgi:hypothetical protein
MKKILLTALLVFACIFSVTAQSAPMDLDAAIRQVSGEIFTSLFEGPRVVPLSFQSSANDLSEYVLREMGLELEKRRCTVAARGDVNRALSARNLKMTDEVNEAAAREIGRNLGTLYVVTGSLDKPGNDYRLIIRLRSVNNNAINTITTLTIRDTPQLQRLLGQPAPAAAPAVAPTPPAPATPAAAPAVVPAAPAAVSPAVTPAIQAYKIGDTGPAGGLIFYDKGNNSGGWRYLEAAPEDLPRRLKFATENFYDGDNAERAVGKGITNTRYIMKEAGRRGGGFGWAAQACDALTVNGFGDWFLPSRDELHYIYGHLHMQGLGNFRNESYWSSTSSNDYYVWAEDFTNGRQDTRGNGNEFRVRPIRQLAGPAQ